MSGDIEKLAVFDSRIVQSRPKYAVEKGALSLTNAPFNAIAATASQHTYNIYVPSENVYVDRAVEWSSTTYQQFQVAIPGGPVVVGEPIVRAGVDFALRSFPLNALCSTLTATINDTTSVINTQDVLNEVLRLTDYAKNRTQRTCPTMLDSYASYNDAANALNNPLAGYENTPNSSPDKVPNGAFYNLVFTDATGTPMSSYQAGQRFVAGVPVAGAVPQPVVPGVPDQYVLGPGLVPSFDGVSLGPYSIFIRWRSTEKLVLSPFVFSDVHEWDTGLFGINNIQLIMNLRDSTRTLRTTTQGGRTISAIGYNTGVSGGSVFQDSVVNVQFLTPSLDVPLPPKSVVPYMEFPRYITQYNQTPIQPGQVAQIQSQTITLPQIPDLFIIYVKPSVALTSTDADYYLPVATSADGVRNPLSVNFDNFSGLLSSQTAEQLYGMSIKNGLEMDWNQWAGYAHSQAPTAYPASSAGVGQGRVPLTGGLLVLKPSQDVTLQTGQAPSLVGNFTFQFNLSVKNTTAVAQSPVLFVITANSGFFESIRGSSRIIKGVLSEQDIISAPLAPMGTRADLERLVGAGMFGRLANVLSKARDVYQATKPYHGAMMDAGKAAMGAMSGSAMSGAAMTGGAKKGKLSARLM